MTIGHSLALLAIVLFALWLFLQPRQQQLRIDATLASCEPVNPCLTMVCETPKAPFGGVDPDAGERDQRRIA